MTSRPDMREKLKGALAFFHHEAAGGLVLVVAALAALLASNSPLAWLYDGVPRYAGWRAHRRRSRIDKPLLHWINDGLMAIFFFLVGLEIKRELLRGELSTVGQAALPAIAALGGMIVPAVIYVAINSDDPAALRGWAIPTATDIAFAVGVLALLGPRVPSSLKIFLLALAILDDLGAIVIIALFYTENLSLPRWCWRRWASPFCGPSTRAASRGWRLMSLTGLFIWVCVLKSGVHATLAGVVVAIAIPLTSRSEGEPSLLEQLEESLHPWVAFAVLPLFAFANAGVSLQGLSLDKLLEPIPLGIAAGLFVGKAVGIFGATWIAVMGGLPPRPEGATWLPDPGRRPAGRHRLHHEPVHRHAGVPRPRAGGAVAARRAGRLAAVGGGRISGAQGVEPADARAHHRDDLAFQRLRRDRADVLVDDLALAVDDEGLGHAGDAPLDRRAPVGVDAHRSERIAVAAEEAACRRRLVLVVDAVELHARAPPSARPALDARRRTGRTRTPRNSRPTPRPWRGRRWRNRRRGGCRR